MGSPVGGARKAQEALPDADIDDNYINLKPNRPNIHDDYINKRICQYEARVIHTPRQYAAPRGANLEVSRNLLRVS